eukprot:5937625-Amphidinium_carterae.1
MTINSITPVGTITKVVSTDFATPVLTIGANIKYQCSLSSRIGVCHEILIRDLVPPPRSPLSAVISLLNCCCAMQHWLSHASGAVASCCA